MYTNSCKLIVRTLVYPLLVKIKGKDGEEKEGRTENAKTEEYMYCIHTIIAIIFSIHAQCHVAEKLLTQNLSTAILIH